MTLEFSGAKGKLIAPVRHTVLLVSIFVGITISGAVFQHKAQTTPGMLRTHPNVIPLYLSTIAVEWVFIYGIWAGVHRYGGRLRDLIGGRWASAKDVMIDIAVAAIVWIIWLGIQIGVSRLWGKSSAKSIDMLTPQHAIEIVLWFVLSITAGIAEEIGFRGYFQKQFQAMTGSAWIGLVLPIRHCAWLSGFAGDRNDYHFRLGIWRCGHAAQKFAISYSGSCLVRHLLRLPFQILLAATRSTMSADTLC